MDPNDPQPEGNLDRFDYLDVDPEEDVETLGADANGA